LPRGGVRTAGAGKADPHPQKIRPPPEIRSQASLSATSQRCQRGEIIMRLKEISSLLQGSDSLANKFASGKARRGAACCAHRPAPTRPHPNPSPKIGRGANAVREGERAQQAAPLRVFVRRGFNRPKQTLSAHEPVEEEGLLD